LLNREPLAKAGGSLVLKWYITRRSLPVTLATMGHLV
jgi:hypothetical protein